MDKKAVLVLESEKHIVYCKELNDVTDYLGSLIGESEDWHDYVGSEVTLKIKMVSQEFLDNLEPVEF